MVKEFACNVGDPSLTPGSGRPLCLENSMDREAWQNTVHGVIELDMTE